MLHIEKEKVFHDANVNVRAPSNEHRDDDDSFEIQVEKPSTGEVRTECDELVNELKEALFADPDLDLSLNVDLKSTQADAPTGWKKLISNASKAFDAVARMTPEQRTEALAAGQTQYLEKDRDFKVDADKIAEAVQIVLSAKFEKTGRARHKEYNKAQEKWFEGIGHTDEQRAKAEKGWKKAGTIYPARGAPMSLLTSAIPGVSAMTHASAAATAAAGLTGFTVQPVVTSAVFTMPVLSVCELLRGSGGRPVLHPEIEKGDSCDDIRRAFKANTGNLSRWLAAYKADPNIDNAFTLQAQVEEAQEVAQRHRNLVAVKQRQWVPAARQGPVRGAKVGVNAALIATGAAFAPPVALAAGVGSSAVFNAANMVAARYDEISKMNFIHRMNMKYAIPYLLTKEGLEKMKSPEGVKTITGKDILVDEVRKLDQRGGPTRVKFVEGVVKHQLQSIDNKRIELDRSMLKLQAKLADPTQAAGMSDADKAEANKKVAALQADKTALGQDAARLQSDVKLMKEGRWTEIEPGQVQTLLLSDAKLLFRDTLRRFATFGEMVPEMAQQVAYYFHAAFISYFGSTALPYTDKLVHAETGTHASKSETVGVAAGALGLGGAGAACYSPTSNYRYWQKKLLSMQQQAGAGNEKGKGQDTGGGPSPRDLLTDNSTLSLLERRDLHKQIDKSRLDACKANMLQAVKIAGGSLIAGITEPVGVLRMSRAYKENKAVVAEAKAVLAPKLDEMQQALQETKAAIASQELV